LSAEAEFELGIQSSITCQSNLYSLFSMYFCHLHDLERTSKIFSLSFSHSLVHSLIKYLFSFYHFLQFVLGAPELRDWVGPIQTMATHKLYIQYANIHWYISHYIWMHTCAHTYGYNLSTIVLYWLQTLRHLTSP
jgi:hypothetical protein